MAFLRERVTRRRAAATLLGVSFLAAYREAFETVLFYQALLASGAPPSAAFVGAAGGAVVLVAIVLAYSRAGRFAPPQTFFRISGHLLYALTVVFAGQGIAALQATGVVPLHPVPGPTVPAIGLFPTVETLAVQLLLLGLAVVGWLAGRRASASPPPPRGTAPIPRPTVDDAAQATPAE
jgi:high-affinity iron transporter